MTKRISIHGFRGIARLSLMIVAGLTSAMIGAPVSDPIDRAADGPSLRILDPGAVRSCGDGPEYYKIALVSTRKLPGTYGSKGYAEVQYAPSPFGISMSAYGEYVYDLSISVENLRAPANGLYVVWLATPNLEDVVHLGPLEINGNTAGQVSFNKFLVIVSFEEPGYSPVRWSSQIALRGLSRSGKMHTSIGHGLFQDEPCARYGFN